MQQLDQRKFFCWKVFRRMDCYSFAPVALILLLCSSAIAADDHHPIQYHNGPLLTGDLNLSILWYGSEPKGTLLKFIYSLKDDGSTTFEPKVSDWWKMVESYRAIAKNGKDSPPSARINVKVASQVSDTTFSMGKNWENNLNDTIPGLVHKATNGKPDGTTIAVIVLAEGVNMPCDRQNYCYEHGVLGNNQIYMIIKNNLKHCTWRCAWPFHKAPSNSGELDLVLNPPTRDEGTHLSIIHLASALASTVTNPHGNGFYGEDREGAPIEIGQTCSMVFGSGYFLGYSGRVRMDPHTGGAFNAHGANNSRFLLPGLWNPRDTGKCWTIM